MIYPKPDTHTELARSLSPRIIGKVPTASNLPHVYFVATI